MATRCCASGKRTPGSSQIPFIVYTATYTDPKDEQLALNLGANAFILKPAEPEDFMARIQQVLAHPAAGGMAAPPPLAPTARGRIPIAAPEEENARNLRQYSKVLIHKLEDKMEAVGQGQPRTRSAIWQSASGRRMNCAGKPPSSKRKWIRRWTAFWWWTAREGKILQNQRMNELWKIPPQIAGNKDDAAQMQFVASRTKNPKEFADKVASLNSHPDEVSRDEIELVDGTVLDRYSSPVRDKAGKYYGRIWTFRDITEHRKLEAQFRQIAKNGGHRPVGRRCGA